MKEKMNGVFIKQGYGYDLQNFLETYNEEMMLEHLDLVTIKVNAKITAGNGIKMAEAARYMDTLQNTEDPIELLRKIDSILKELA